LSRVADYDIRVDLHVHTIASGHAYSTVAEVARAAAARGLEAIAIADHGPALPSGAHAFHFWNMRVIPRLLEGVFILRSVEANIVDAEGGLDLSDEVLQNLDIVQAGLHPGCGYEGRTPEENTRAMLGALRHPLVDVIVHPGNPGFPIDIHTVVEAARREGKALEINNASYVYTRKGSRENDLLIVEAVRREGVWVSVGSDAHIADFAGEFSHAVEIIADAGLKPDRVINRDLTGLRRFLQGRGKVLDLEGKPN
jgi:putative hydrolase